MCSYILQKMSRYKILTTQILPKFAKVQSCLQSNSNQEQRSELISTKFSQHTAARYTRGNVQQYFKTIVTKQNYDDSKLTILLEYGHNLTVVF